MHFSSQIIIPLFFLVTNMFSVFAKVHCLKIAFGPAGEKKKGRLV